MDLDLQEVFVRHGLRRPKRLTLAVTGVCNLACARCRASGGSASSPGE